MNKIEKFFDINMVLMSVFSSLETIIDEKNIELIYDIDATVPKELKGNEEVLSNLLTQLLTFVLENTHKREVVLSLLAPKDFLYEESISFEIKENDFSKEKITSFLENRLSKNLQQLEAEVIDEDPSDIHINIPFKLNELGNRRYYRLPDISMLGKKVLLICESSKMATSIEKMFKYFLYDVVVGVDAYKQQGSDMAQYDILVIDNAFNTDMLENIIAKVQKETALKYVLLQDPKHSGTKKIYVEATSLIKPVMQETIYELIISLFENSIDSRDIRSRETKHIIDIAKYMNKVVKKEEKSFTQKNVLNKLNQNTLKEDETERVVLDSNLGEENAGKVGSMYAKELNKFLDIFTGSDRYFRQVVNEKQTWQIKEFCIDLEKQTKTIGAESMSNLANQVGLLFVYDKLDMLPVYTNKYHLELTKLIAEIKTYLNKTSK